MLFRSAEKGYFARVKNFRATITFAAQAAGSVFRLAVIPPGMTFISGTMVTDTDTDTTTFAIGSDRTSSTSYKTAITLTQHTPVTFGRSVANTGAFTAEEKIYMTTAVKALPESGTLVFDILCASAN